MSKKEVWVFGTVLRIFCRFFSIYLVIKVLIRLKISSATRTTIGPRKKLTENLSYLDLRIGKDFEKTSIIYSL